MNYKDIEPMSERAIIWIYRSKFSFKHFQLKDDLMQEARIMVWQEMEKCNNINIDYPEFVHFIPKIAYRAMITFIRKRYHLQSKSGYIETQIPGQDDSIDDIIYTDYRFQEFMLFMDVDKVLKTDINQVRSTIYMLYAGYSFPEIAVIRDKNRSNVWRSSQRFGQRLLSAWA